MIKAHIRIYTKADYRLLVGFRNEQTGDPLDLDSQFSQHEFRLYRDYVPADYASFVVEPSGANNNELRLFLDKEQVGELFDVGRAMRLELISTGLNGRHYPLIPGLIINATDVWSDTSGRVETFTIEVSV